jgi:hypothetical protein
MPTNAAPRRLFFRFMARETLVWCEELCGVRHVRLSDVAGFPPHVFASLIPKVCPGVEILPEAARVCARLPGAKDAIPLFSTADQASLAVFNSFNGETALGKIAGDLAGSMAWTAAESAARVRELFLKLLELRVCAPCNGIPEEQGKAPPPGA